MGRKIFGAGDRGLASYIREQHPELVDEAKDYWATFHQRNAARMRETKRLAEVARLEGQLAAIQTKLRALGGEPNDDYPNGRQFAEMEAVGAVILR